MHKIVLAYYGDDFTGSTDALEFISNAGAKAMLFIDPPEKDILEKYPDLDVYGVAGKTRALPASEVYATVLEAFKKMQTTGAKHIHYKVCSTFDSSPTIGSIGKVIDAGDEVFNNRIIPVIGGAPALGRYCVFGNLFARMGIGSKGEIYRLDRHPSMSRHPVTPATESDLRLHLSKQTEISFGLINFVQQQQSVEEWERLVEDNKAVLIDAIDNAQLIKIGAWLEALAHKQTPLFTVGPSSVEMALGNYWIQENKLKPFTSGHTVGASNQLLVISGSCSSVTTKQLQFAKANGFEEVIIEASKVCDNQPDANIEHTLNSLHSQGKNVILHTGLKEEKNLSSEKLGTYLGTLAKNAVSKYSLSRLGVAGGDTSSYAARAMGIEAVEMIASSGIGAPLCRVFSKEKEINGLEINFKGGQVGADDFFTKLLKGNFN